MAMSMGLEAFKILCQVDHAKGIYSGTLVCGHLTGKVTSRIRSILLCLNLFYTVQQIGGFYSPGNTVTSPLRSLLLSPMGDLNSKVPL